MKYRLSSITKLGLFGFSLNGFSGIIMFLVCHWYEITKHTSLFLVRKVIIFSYFLWHFQAVGSRYSASNYGRTYSSSGFFSLIVRTLLSSSFSLRTSTFLLKHIYTGISSFWWKDSGTCINGLWKGKYSSSSFLCQ